VERGNIQPGLRHDGAEGADEVGLVLVHHIQPPRREIGFDLISAIRCRFDIAIDESCASALGTVMVARPRPCILDEFEYLGFVHGQQRWATDRGKRLYTWDSLHGEVEVFNGRDKHVGVKHAVTGDWIKDAVPGRSIDV
jgi:hypothetical protein